jgi:predicted permease
VRAIAGERAVPTVLLYDQLGTYLALATYGAVVVAVLGAGPRPKTADVGRRILAFPPFLATAVALPIALFCSATDLDFHWPTAVGTALDYAGAAVAPAALWAVALRAVRTAWRKPDAMFVGTLLAKLALAPAVVLAAVTVLGIARPFELNVSILELAMPSSVAASAIAADAGFEPELCARVTAAGLVVSFATLPLWGAVLGW